jgi:prepilin-type N-terminal cleavage/methylation domain-containing protein
VTDDSGDAGGTDDTVSRRRVPDSRDDSGFTLIELLIVIVILGILAAIVVFAVNGIQDRGTASACKADVETVTVAAEAYDAQHGRYAESMEQLVKEGLLHSVPSDSHYTIEYVPNNDSKTPSVSVSSTYCSDANAGDSPSSDSPSTEAPSSVPSSADQLAAYCTELGSALQRFQGLNFNAIDVDQFQKAVSIFEEVQAAAPDDISGDWGVLVATVKKMQQIVSATGLSHADLVLLANGGMPDTFSQDQLNQLNQDLQGPFSSQEFGSALNTIFSHAQNACGINL